MNRIGRSRAARIASGKEQLATGSTFRRKSWKEVIADQAEMDGRIKEIVFGPKRTKAMRSQADDRRIAKARAWTQFSLFIRLRDSDEEGRGKCVTCWRCDHWRKMDAGHWITRAKEATLFDERNTALQCKNCNRFQGGKPLEHEQAIIRRYGPEAPEEIKRKAVQLCRRDIRDYYFIEDCYRKKVAEIREKSPGKFNQTK